MIGHSEAKNNPYWLQFAKSLSMGDLNKKESYRRVKHFLEKAGANKIDKDNVTKLENVVQDFKDHAAEKGIDLSTGNSSALYRQEDVNKIFDSIVNTDDYKYLTQDLPDTEKREVDGVKKKFHDIPDHLSDTHLKKEHGLNEAQAQSIETKYIDELWGTEGAEKGTASGFGALSEGDVKATWGLDLKRVTPSESLEIGSQEHYEHITRGEVNWASYADDKMYNKAMFALGYDVNKLDDDSVSEAKRAGWVREATALIHGKVGDEDDYDDVAKDAAKEKWGKEAGVKKWDDWTPEDWKFDNPYDNIKREGDELYIDGERQVKMSERLAIPAGSSKEVVVGKDKDGKNIKKTVQSAYMDVNSHIKINGKEATAPFMGGNTKDVDIEIRTSPSNVWKTTIEPVKTPREVKKPNIKGIKWDSSGKPTLTNPTKVQTAPTI